MFDPLSKKTSSLSLNVPRQGDLKGQSSEIFSLSFLLSNNSSWSHLLTWHVYKQFRMNFIKHSSCYSNSKLKKIDPCCYWQHKVKKLAFGDILFSNFKNLSCGQYYTCMVDFLPSCPFEACENPSKVINGIHSLTVIPHSKQCEESLTLCLNNTGSVSYPQKFSANNLFTNPTLQIIHKAAILCIE
jgi:hypothetical protein